MRKRFARFLALMLVLCLTPFAALAEDTDAAPEENPVVETLNNTPSSLVTLGGQLYAVSGWDGVFQKVDGGWKRALSFATENGSYDVLATATADDTLYVMVRDYSGESTVHAIMTTHVEDGALAPLTKVADVDFSIGEDYYPQLYGMAADKDNVWFLIYPDSGDWNNNDLYRVTLSDGKATKLTRDHLTGLTPYTGDKLLAVYSNYEAENEEDRRALVAVDKETGAIEKLCSLRGNQNYLGLTYDSASGYVYITDDSHLYRFDSTFAEATLCAYLPPHSSDNSASGTIFDGKYYLPDWSDSRYMACTVDPALLPSRVLRMNYSNSGDDLLRAFCLEHPEIALETGSSDAYTAEDISRAMTSGDNSADIFSLYLSNGTYEALRRKGYCYDLSGSEILSGFVSRMYPHFAKVLMQDTKLCAIPSYVSVSSIGYFPLAFEKVGLTEEDVPTTMMEMLDFIQMWVDDYADEYPEMQLFQGSYRLREQLFSMIFQMQISYCEAQGETLTFDTPVIRKLLSRLEEIGPALKSMEPEENSAASMVFYSDDPNALFTTYASILPDRYGSGRRWNGYPMILALDEGMTPALSMNMSAYIVNPNSENTDLAVTFLEYMVEHMYQDTKITLLPDENEPYQNEYYEQNMKYYDESIAMTTEALESAAEEDKAMYEEQLTWLKEAKERTEKEERWAISAEEIAEYREIAQYLTILSTDMFSGANNEASNLMQRYIDGQIGAEQFIKEFSRIIRMIQMENQ